MLITVKHHGNFKKTDVFLNHANDVNYTNILDRYGREGVDALSAATPTESGKTASSWVYEIRKMKNGTKLVWKNTNIVDGVPIAILIQYGHGTRNGGYVMGRDYINPAMQPIFDAIAEEAWREVIKNG